jgi:cbb3-type cytochrome oxidase maturation protein
MIVILLLIPLSIVIAICFLAAFIWAVRSGQYEDTCTPSMRLLMEEKRRADRPSAKMRLMHKLQKTNLKQRMSNKEQCVRGGSAEILPLN